MKQVLKRIRYVFLGFKLFRFISNWWDLPFLILGYKSKVILKNSMSFLIHDYLNLLQLLEIIYNEEYKVILSKPRVIIDIGSNIGDSTVYFAKKYPSARIYAFEPNNKIYQILNQNLKLNEIRNTESFNLAVANRKSLKKFYNFTFSGLSGFKNIGRNGLSNIVKTTTLSEFFRDENIMKCDLLKMDCEGAEFEILLNLDKKLFKRIKNIILEYHNGLTNFSEKDLINKLRNQGYKLRVKKHSIEDNIGIIYARR